MSRIQTLGLDFSKPTATLAPSKTISLDTFNSYNFDRNILTPASAFRFTAPGVDADDRQAIRSGDIVSLWILNDNKIKIPVAVGIIDETDTHEISNAIEYVLTGRDLLGQLVDNTAVDKNNKIIHLENATLQTIISLMIANTRIPQGITPQQLPNGTFLFQTNPGETKINAIQRYLDLANCLIWALPSGQICAGKPNFTRVISGTISNASSSLCNYLEARVKRNVNQVIRQIVYQLQTLDSVSPTPYTKTNTDKDISPLINGGVGRSVWNHFSYGQGADTVNLLKSVGNQSGSPAGIGNELCLRDIARDNMKILDVELVVKGHLNTNNTIYNIDQIYNVQIPSDDVDEDLYVYGCSYELTMDHGMITRLRLCRLGSIVANTDATPRSVAI